MKRKLILTAFFIVFLFSNASATVQFDGGIQVNDSYIETGETVEITVDAESNEQIMGVDAKYNPWMDWEQYEYCTGYSTCDASWTFTPYVTGERTIEVRSRSSSMPNYYTEERTITVHSSTAEERWVRFQDLPDSFQAGESYKIDAEAYDSEGRLYSEEFILESRPDYGGIGYGSWSEIDSTFCWDYTGEECSVSGNFQPTSSPEGYQIKGSINLDDGTTISRREYVSVEDNTAEPSVDISNIRSTDTNIEEGDSTRFKTDLSSNQDVGYLEVSFKADGITLATINTNLDAGEDKTVSSESLSWNSLNDELDTGQEYDLKVEVSNTEIDNSRTANNAFTLAEADQDFNIGDYGPSGTVDSPVELFVELDDNPATGWCKWEEGNSVNRYASERMSKPDPSQPNWEDEVEFSSGTKTVSFQCFNHGGAITSEETTTFTVEDEQKVEINSLRSTNTHINEGENTNFETELSVNEDVDYLEVDFYVDGEEIEINQEPSLDAGETLTVSSEVSWNALQQEVPTGQNHDLEVRLNSRDFEKSRTVDNEFYLAEADERPSCEEFDDSDLDIDLENFESIPEEGNNYDSSVRLYNNGDRDLGGNLGLYVKESNQVMNCGYYNDHYNDLIAFTGSNVYPDSGSSDAFDFSYSGNPLDDLEYGETYSLVAVFNSDSTTYVGPAGAIQWRESEEQDRDPTARFSWDRHPVKVGESVEFDGSASTDPDGDINQYRWSFDDGSGYSYGVREDHSFGSTGTYDVQLRVRDSQGNTDFRTREVEVVRNPGDCSIRVGRLNFGDSIITRGESTQASITVNNNGEDQQFTVKFVVEGNTVRTVDREISENSQSTFTASVSPQRDSIVTAKVMTEGAPCGDRTYQRQKELVVVEDGDGGDDGDDSRKPDASFRWSPSQPEPEETVRFDGSNSHDDDGDIVEYKWFFGDGSSPNYGRTVQHSYGSTGDYDVQLVVEDSDGNTDSTTRTVPVVQEPGACSLRVGQIRFGDSIITRGESTTGSITVSNLGDEQVVNVRFKEGTEVVQSREVVIEANSQRTFSTSLNPQIDKIIKAEVTTDESPCGSRSFNRQRELVVVEGGAQSSTLQVNVESESGRQLQNARVSVQGEGTSTTRYTGYQGDAYFELDSGDYDIAVSRSGYRTEVRNVDLNSGSDRTITVTLGRRDSGQGTFTALVEDGEGNRLRNAEIAVENGVTKYRETDSNGRATVNLDAGIYSVTAEKTGYGSWTETVNIDRGEETTRVFRLTGDTREGLRIADVDYANSVCRGSTLRAQVTIENNEGYHEFVSLTGKGLGSINAVSRFSLDAGETVTKTVHFTNVQGSGSEQFTVTVNNDDSDSTTRTVDVESCGTTARGEPTDISMQMTYTKQPNMAVAGDILKVEGFVDGANGRSTVDIDIDGETKASVRTQPDGYYRTWITASEVGPKTVTASAGDVTASRPLRVIPTSKVTNLEAPVSIFEGQTYQVCARVESQIEPEVILERDGEVVTSKTANGRVCFEQQAREPGMHKYRIAALTSGEGNTASSTVEVLKMDVEASSFPGQIASVESGSGMVRVDLYNTNENQTRYDLNLEGLPSTWTSQSEKQVILDKGERRTVYFYLTPQDEGSYEPTISVTSRGSEIYREKLDVITGGTTESRPKDRSFFGSLAEGLKDLFSF